ncbi:hypothetical protein M409DRAFT_20366 [Zasmidium cellare ATCC 36951]|uniref:Protein kinase domain-containing protein n=1 Tax=Zasmidium cellare ATCC 36951 TaxID=1080233 RepID=A0A6A6CSK8_ZASCE|nr:uncharacterized protein M409DRAFT_20366 [Zasmidium cellare ATCC 36951]KAF2169140.1 hypothetical protein M409DRAFT_20366 [Zasmidium cellare ATCC 36951]
MAAHIAWLPRTFGTRESPQRKSRSRPLPLRIRTYSEAGFQSPGFDESHEGRHLRNKSLSVATEVAELSPTTLKKMEDGDEDEVEPTENESPRSSLDGSVAGFSDNSSLAGSPLTPLTGLSSGRSSLDSDGPEVLSYDFSRIDYELERAKVLGTGLWSTVYMAKQKPVNVSRSGLSLLSPPRSPRLSQKSRTTSIPALFAIKTPLRQDAKAIFYQEARVLTHLQRRPTSSLHIIPFYGLDPRNSSLIFEAIIGGSLEDLTSRMKQMTEVARHLELITLFPGIAFDLINGLDFLHCNGVIHADIKPGNILLDISAHATDENKAVVRARYIDFSAAFIPSKGDSASNAGGTWDYMAPEQMRIQPEWNTPTFASDVWSLGITLLYVMVGDSPYSAACGGNMFMLREAIKSGDPLQFARMETRVRKRLAACQDFVDCVRLAVKKEREIRVTAAAWAGWLVEWEREG